MVVDKWLVEWQVLHHERLGGRMGINDISAEVG